MAHECPSRSSRLPDADETTVCMVVGGWFAAGATHHFDAGVPNISISFVDCRPAPLGGLAPRNPLNETSSSGSSYLVGPRESHLDLHHLLWSLLFWIAVMTVACYSKKSSTPCASKDRVRRQQIGAIYFRQSHGDSVAALARPRICPTLLRSLLFELRPRSPSRHDYGCSICRACAVDPAEQSGLQV